MQRNCNICNTLYQAEARYVNRGQGLTCSKQCGFELASRKRKKIHDSNTTCAYCGTAFYKKNSSKRSKTDTYYCCSEHQKFGSALGIHHVGPFPRTTGQVSNSPLCEVCFAPLRGKSLVCRPCKPQHVINKWLAGDNSVTLNRSRTTRLPVDTKAFVKRYLIGIRGDMCEVCGWDEKSPDGRSIIQMDHINGDCFDNRPENLKLLCPNHHAMTETYGSRNRGSGRAHRRRHA